MTPKGMHDRSPFVAHHPTLNCNTRYRMVILVLTDIYHIERREWIRETFGNSSLWFTQQHFKVIFAIAVSRHHKNSNAYMTLVEESRNYDDILTVQENEDHRNQETHNLMVALEWVNDYVNFDFLLNVKYNVFVNLDNAMVILERKYADRDYFGLILKDIAVPRPMITQEVFPNDTFEPYCSGAGYFLSKQAIAQIIPFFNWNAPFVFSDVYVSMLTTLAGIEPVPLTGK